MKQKINWTKLSIAIVLLGLFIWGGYYVIKAGQSKQSQQEQIQEEAKTISYEGVEGKTALEILKETHQIEGQDSDFGIFVTSIDNIENSSDTFWMFYVNGTLSDVAADKYTTKAGDRIEWKYEKSPF